MQRNLVMAAFAAGLTLSVATAGQAQRGDYRFSVRNDTGGTLTCRVQREGRSRFETIVLRAGQVWSDLDRNRRNRSIYCDPPAAPIRYRLRANTSYHIVPHDQSVHVVLRTM
jgi:hypothetical protein